MTASFEKCINIISMFFPRIFYDETVITFSQSYVLGLDGGQFYS